MEQGVEPGNSADVDGLRVAAVKLDVEAPGPAEHQVHVLGQEAQFHLGPGASGRFLRVVGPRSGQAQPTEWK